MNKLVWGCTLLFSLSLTVQAEQSDMLNQFLGEWEGAGIQDDGSQWTMRLNIRADGYFIDYPSIVCGGEWKLLRSTESRLIFKEILTYGIDRCIDQGEVIIKLADDKASYHWFSYQEKMEAIGSLTRKPFLVRDKL